MGWIIAGVFFILVSIFNIVTTDSSYVAAMSGFSIPLWIGVMWDVLRD